MTALSVGPALPVAAVSEAELVAIRRARVGLMAVSEPPRVGVSKLVGRVGAVDAWDRVRDGSVSGQVREEVAARVDGASPEQLEVLIDRHLEAASAVGARLVIPEDPEWPEAAFHGFVTADRRGASGSAAPIGLWVRGAELTGLGEQSVTVVGSRACSPYGERVAADLSLGLAEQGLVVISGAAFGVDAAAHRAALAVSFPRCTVAVLACGIDRVYPAAHKALIDAVAGRGAVVSEYPPGTPPARFRFLVRNRIIAALGAGTVVVEAGRRSGTLSTATAAIELSRPLMVVPGPITSALSVGCHLLITERRGLLVTCTADVLRILWPAGRGQPELTFDPGTASATAAEQSKVRSVGAAGGVPDGLDGEAIRILDALPSRGSRSIAELARAAAVPTAGVFAALSTLAVQGLATHTGTGWRRIHHRS